MVYSVNRDGPASEVRPQDQASAPAPRPAPGGSGGKARHLRLLPEPDRARPAAADGGAAAHGSPSSTRRISKSFGSDEQARLVSDLHEVFGDALFEAHDVTTTDLRETAVERDGLAGDREALPRVPRRARVHAGHGVARLGRRRPARDRPGAASLRGGLRRSPGEPELLSRARGGGRAAGRRRRASSARIRTPASSRICERRGISVAITPHPGDKSPMRRYDPARKRLHVSEILPPPRAQLPGCPPDRPACTSREDFERVIAKSRLTTPDSVALCRVALANYFASAVLMPYGPFLESARSAALRHRGARAPLRRELRAGLPPPHDHAPPGPGRRALPLHPRGHRRQHLQALLGVGHPLRALLGRSARAGTCTAPS